MSRQGYIRLYDYKLKSGTASFGCSLGCMVAVCDDSTD